LDSRSATITVKEDNTHLLRVDKDSYNKIVRDIEANTVRLKELGSDVLVLEKSPRLHKYGITLSQIIIVLLCNNLKAFQHHFASTKNQ